MPVIACHDLTKRYGPIVALHHINLAIEQGMSFGLLGENGAGKSTLVKLLMGFIFPTTGRVIVLGEEQVARAHPRIGYIHELPTFERRFTGHQYLTYLGKLAGYWGAANRNQVDHVLALVDLTDAARRPIKGYSKGMMQRLAIAQALYTNPDLLILDEPTTGLDPRNQIEIRQIIKQLRQDGKTILLCSHHLNEVEELCDNVGILRNGELILSGAVADLLYTGDITEIVLADGLVARTIVRDMGLTTQVLRAYENTLRVPSEVRAPVLAKLIEQGVEFISVNPLRQTLEDVYMEATFQEDTMPRRAVRSEAAS